MNRNMIAGLAVALCASAATAAPQTERVFSYTDPGAETVYFGTSKAETYDIAIHVDGVYAGKSVKGLKVALAPKATVSDPKGWLTSELKLDSKKNNVPDIVSAEATVSEDNVLSITFDQPYTIGAEGLYAGYSITVKSLADSDDDNPNVVSENAVPGGLYVHTSRTYRKWVDMEETYGYVSALEVTLAGEFPDAAVAVAEVKPVYGTLAENTTVAKAVMMNNGSAAVNTLGYSYVYSNGKSGSGTVTLSQPLVAKLGAKSVVELPVEVADASGTITVKVESVDGVANGDAGASATGQYTLMPFVPVMRPLMEEYTGLWCGYCPRGLIAMERMSELYPDRFVAVSYHEGEASSEPLQYLTQFPQVVDGFPTAFFNRAIECDPYYGVGTANFGVRDLWVELSGAMPVADLDVALEWNEDKSALVCTSKTRFISDVAGDDYRVSYILLADDLKTDRSIGLMLSQSNYFAGSTAPDDYPLWDMFCNGGDVVTGATFNDVAVAYNDQAGVQAFPASVKAGEEYTHSYVYDYADMVNIAGRNILTEKNNLHCVAVVTKADGTFVNCNKSAQVSAQTVSVESVDGAAEVMRTDWYDLQGRKVSAPGAGIYLRSERLSDGTVRVSKQVLGH